MRFFFDVSISTRLVKALRVLAEFQPYELSTLEERFDASTPDPTWLRQLGRESGWVVVSADPKITRGKAERAAWAESGLTAFFFSEAYSSRTIWNQASELMHWWPDILRLAKDNASGTGFLIPARGGKIKPIYPPR